jgi:hypothetical protein
VGLHQSGKRRLIAGLSLPHQMECPRRPRISGTLSFLFSRP